MAKWLQTWGAFVLALIGALAWSPTIWNALRPNKVDGKIISIYNNFSADKKKIFLLLKVSLVSMRKDFFLKDVSLIVRFRSSQPLTATSRNMRLVVFNIDGAFKKLTVPGKEFINNLSVLPKGNSEVGYLFFSVNYNQDEPFREIDLILTSFDGQTKTLHFAGNEIDSDKLLFDDSIWAPVDLNDPLIKKLLSVG